METEERMRTERIKGEDAQREREKKYLLEERLFKYTRNIKWKRVLFNGYFEKKKKGSEIDLKKWMYAIFILIKY